MRSSTTLSFFSTSASAIAIAVALASLAALPVAAQPAAKTLRVQINADVRSTEPGVNRDDNSDMLVMHLFEGLVALREDTTVGPLLASKIDVSPDGLRYTFTLRDGVKFHNDQPLTAADVVWSWKRFLDPATNWRCLPEFDGRGAAKIVSVEARDPKTVVFTLEQATGLLLATMARPDCGGAGIAHRSSVDADNRWTNPVGTGPYKLVNWKRGQSIELTRFAGYASRAEPRDGFTGGKKAEVENLKFLVIPDASAAKAALFNGDIDVFAGAASPDVAELRGRPGIQVEVSPSMNMVGVLFQTRDPLLQDVRVRRALALALDMPEIARAVSDGLSRPNSSIVPTASPYYSAPHAAVVKRDLAQAKKLLKDAGYQGQPIKLLTNKRYAVCFDSAVMVQAMAAEAGFKIELEVLDWAAQLDRYSRGQYQAMAFVYSSRLDPSLSYETVSGPKATQPRKVWDQPEVRTRVAESMATADRAKRQAIFDDLHRRMLEDVPMVMLFNGSDVAGLRANVAGYKGWPADKPRFWNVRFQ